MGKAVNRGGGYGMEVPCVYRFSGQERYIKLLKNLSDIENNLSVRDETRKRYTKQEGNSKKKSKPC